jgi:hypothetical protein
LIVILVVGGSSANRSTAHAELHALEESLHGCQIIGSYRSSQEVYALSFASDYLARVHGYALEKLYPGTIHYDSFHERFISFGDVKSDYVKRLVSNGQCVPMECTPLDVGVLQRLVQNDGIQVTTLITASNPIIPGDATALYRLEPRGLP